MKTMKRLLVTLGLIAALAMPVCSNIPVMAATSVDSAKDQVCAGVGTADGSGNCQNGNARLNDLVRAIINTFSLIVGIVAVIMIIIAGFKYVTSGGDSSAVSSAKNTLIYAIVGLVIVVLSQAIVQFVLQKTS